MVDQPRDDKGRWKKSGVGVAAVATVGVVAIAGGGGLGGAASTADSATSSGSHGKSSGKSSGKDAARKGQRDAAWQRMGLKVVKKALKRELLCSTRSFGEVQRFFVRTPCRKLDRMVLAIGDGGGNTVVVSIAWVRMATADDAARLKRLTDTDGTGNVSPLGAAALGLAEIRFDGHHYDSRQDGSLVVIAEAAPAGGQPDNAALDDAADVADEFPPP
ncbi:hypothetical protein [Amycolatopsis sp. H20-H5]|uniref:hypothetical protein n=1 Tax=Amycolatopsis sp. H20-H5 TaxID=3046309 RepID=UPI002DBD9D76|nr:hypothetical protein [Amycolatopsis sp. H20-H5]MEC3974103.1 hypothetical protein [Amycolatopsis sp. H20-H5]